MYCDLEYDNQSNRNIGNAIMYIVTSVNSALLQDLLELFKKLSENNNFMRLRKIKELLLIVNLLTIGDVKIASSI